MEVLLSSIAKNDLQLLMRIFKAQEKNNEKEFLEDVKNSIQNIIIKSENSDIKSTEIQVYLAENFPISIHYIFEENNTLFITAIFKV